MLQPTNNRILVQFISPSDSLIQTDGERGDEQILVLAVAEGIDWVKRGDSIAILDSPVKKVNEENRVALVRADAVVSVGKFETSQLI